MALYNVVNSKSIPGGIESAFVVTNGVGKARKLFADRYGAAVADLIVERVDTEARSEPYVLATWDDERQPPVEWSRLDVPTLVSDEKIDRYEEENGF